MDPSATQTNNEIQVAEKRSKHIGALYLNCRIGEFIPKSLAIFILLFHFHNTDYDSHFEPAGTKFLMSLGLLLGNLGNILQGYQGVLDKRLATSHQGLYAETDKLKFANIAMLRGGLNILSDTAALSLLWSAYTPLNIISAVPGVITDSLGLYKNIRDTRNSKAVSKIAFSFCALARLPLLLGSLLLAAARSEDSGKDWLEPALLTLLAGMCLFTTGAMIRQYQYYRDNPIGPLPCFRTLTSSELTEIEMRELPKAEV
jgi:hypothetical protein